MIFELSLRVGYDECVPEWRNGKGDGQQMPRARGSTERAAGSFRHLTLSCPLSARIY